MLLLRLGGRAKICPYRRNESHIVELPRSWKTCGFACAWDAGERFGSCGIFLIETKIKDERLHMILRRLGFSYFLFVPPVGFVFPFFGETGW